MAVSQIRFNFIFSKNRQEQANDIQRIRDHRETARLRNPKKDIRQAPGWRQFEPEVILLAVGWYLRFSLSYRDVEELLAERGLHADHITVWRWVQRYAPELQRCLRRRLKPTNESPVRRGSTFAPPSGYTLRAVTADERE